METLKIFQNGDELIHLDGSQKDIQKSLIAALCTAVKGNLSAESMLENKIFKINEDIIEGKPADILIEFVESLDSTEGITFEVYNSKGVLSQRTSFEGIKALAEILPEFEPFSTRGEGGGRKESKNVSLSELLAG